MNDYEWTFNEDIRDKKRSGRGASHKASRKKGFKGSMRTPYDFMTRKERRELNGEVRCLPLVIPYTEFKAMSKEEKIEILNKYLAVMSRKELATEWGIHRQSINDWIFRLITKSALEGDQPEEVRDIIEFEQPEVVPEVAPVKKSFQLSLNGDMTGSEIKEELLNVAGILRDGRVYTFTVNIESE